MDCVKPIGILLGLLIAAPLSTFSNLAKLTDTTPPREVAVLVSQLVDFVDQRDPGEGFELGIRPFAERIKQSKPALVEQLFVGFAPYHPYRTAIAIALFLVADQPLYAAKSLAAIVQSSWAATKTTDKIIAAVLVQLGQAVVFNTAFAQRAVRLFIDSPYQFCDKIDDYGGVLHLLVPVVLGYGTADMPAALLPGMRAFAQSLGGVIKKEYPELFTIKNSTGQTAREWLLDSAQKVKATRPVAAGLLFELGCQW